MLSADVFADVIQSMQAGQARPADKRRAPRVLHRCRIPVTLFEPDGTPGKTWSVVMRDLSPRGLCILHGQPLPRDTQFVISLDRGAGKPIHLLATVVHCRKDGKSLHVIGAEFTCVLNEVPHARSRPGAAKEIYRIGKSMLS